MYTQKRHTHTNKHTTLLFLPRHVHNDGKPVSDSRLVGQKVGKNLVVLRASGMELPFSQTIKRTNQNPPFINCPEWSGMAGIAGFPAVTDG